MKAVSFADLCGPLAASKPAGDSLAAKADRSNKQPMDSSSPPLATTPARRPENQLLELLGRRWMLRVLWELRDGKLGFRELQARCDVMSPSVLAIRLKELKAANLAEPGDGGPWALTEHGLVLLRFLKPLGKFAHGWAACDG